MTKIYSILFHLILIVTFTFQVYAQEYIDDPVEDDETLDDSKILKDDASEKKDSHNDSNKETAAGKDKDNSKNVNVDMQVIYGQYNNMLSTINLSQEQKDFIYLVSSYFKRSDDFGYRNKIFENTSLYENKIGFTGNYNATDYWKLIPEIEINNDSRGMYDNYLYSREEKDNVRMSMKSVTRIKSSFEGYIKIGGGSFLHRLRAYAPDNQVEGKLNNINSEIGGEYVWSASNRIRFNSGYTQYNFSVPGVPDDKYCESEIVDDFKITRYVVVSIGVNFDWNNDKEAGYLVSPVTAISIKGEKYASILFLYRYDLVPFKPDELYLNQKYINPVYDLPPAKQHHGEVKAELKLNSIFNLKGSFSADKYDNYYNYREITGNVLSIDTVELKSYISRGDANLMLFDKVFMLTISYEYTYFDSEKKITYRPAKSFSNSLKYNGKQWIVEWNNKFSDRVYTDPEDSEKLEEVMIGYFGIQRKMLESFYLYIRVENIYDNRYELRQGYTEPGRTFLGGLRILI